MGLGLVVERRHVVDLLLVCGFATFILGAMIYASSLRASGSTGLSRVVMAIALFVFAVGMWYFLQ